jgi:hypothetical protein
MPALRLLPVVVLALALALAAPLAGCGGEPEPEEEIRGTLEDFEQATRERDYERLCDDVLSRRIVDKVRSVGLPCEAALQRGLGEVEQPRLQVSKIRVTGERAVALVRSTAAGQEPSEDQVALVREGDGWRISELAGTAPPTPDELRERP